MARLRILHLIGSPTSEAFRELSELYGRGCLDALHDPAAYEVVIAHVSPDATWRFPKSLDAAGLAAAPPLSFAEAVSALAGAGIDAALPQMFCPRGMTDLRALLELLAIPYLGERPLQMALAADKAKAKAVVSAAGVAVPAARLLRRGDACGRALPVVVKPNDSDNSDGVTLVTAEPDLAPALAAAFAVSDTVLVEDYIELGREVRCGVIERDGALSCLPLEEYLVDRETRPIRRAVDKLKRDDGGKLVLAAKTRTKSWIVADDDPITPAVRAAARLCHTALGCRQYSLFDFRIDPHGRPWFLEAGLYCSFAPGSVIVTMMAAAGTPLKQFFAEALQDLLRPSGRGAQPGSHQLHRK